MSSRTVILHNNFLGGLNDTASPNQLKDTELVVADNCDLSERGGFGTAQGAIKVNPSSLGGQIVVGFEWNLGPTSRNVIVRDNGTSYHIGLLDGDTGVFTEKQEVAKGEIGHMIVSNRLFFVDGEEMYEWGTYDYPATIGTVDIVTGDIVHNNTVIGDLHFYVALADHGSTDLEAELFTNTSKWRDSTAQAGIASDECRVTTPYDSIDNDLDPIIKCTMFAQHAVSLRIFATGNPDEPSAVYYSDIADITYFKITDKLTPTNNEGYTTAIGAFEDTVLVSYNDTWYYWQGVDVSDATWKILPIPYGCVSHGSLVVTPLSITFLGRTNIHKINVSILNTDVVSLQTSSIISQPTEGKVEDTIKSITDNGKVVSTFYDDKYMMAYCDDGTGINNKVLIYDWNTKGFRISTDWKVNDFCNKSNGELYIMSKNYVLNAFTGYKNVDVETGEDREVNMKIVTKHFDMGNMLNPKYFSKVFFVFRQYTDIESLVNITIRADYKTLILENVDISQSLVYGREWGLTYGWVDQVIFTGELDVVANTVQITIESSQIDIPVTCYAIGFEYESLEINPDMITNREEDLIYGN